MKYLKDYEDIKSKIEYTPHVLCVPCCPHMLALDGGAWDTDELTRLTSTYYPILDAFSTAAIT